jgi:hypothetical protein
MVSAGACGQLSVSKRTYRRLALRILLANYYLHHRSGSELFTVDLARALTSRGHDVYIHAPYLGEPAQNLADEGFRVTGRLSDLSDVDFDVAHVHHNVVAVAVRSAFPKLPMVLLLHGVLPELEQPPSIDLGIAKVLCVSEEVQEHAQSRGAFRAATEVVRNFVNAEYWRPTAPASSRLKHVLVLSNGYPPEMRKIVEAACAAVRASVEHVGLPENPRQDVRPHISQADLVITLGRGALEAMAMERNVIVLGPCGGDGFVDEQSFFELRRRNFSGRTARIEFTPDTLADEMLRYDPRLGRPLRNLVLAENEETKVVGQLERIHQEAAHTEVAPWQNIPLLNEYLFLYQDLCNRGGECGQLRSDLAALYASKSWRSTAPMRSILSLFLRNRQP